MTRVTGKDADGNVTTQEVIAAADISVVHSYDIPTAYELASQNPGKAYLIPETGELILGDDIQILHIFKDIYQVIRFSADSRVKTLIDPCIHSYSLIKAHVIFNDLLWHVEAGAGGEPHERAENDF